MLTEQSPAHAVQTTPIFVTGTQRSGTTLLYRILSASKQMFCWNEMFSVYGALFGEPGKQPVLEHEFAQMMQNRLKLDSEIPAVSKPDSFRYGMNIAANRAGLDRWCVKDPKITYFLPDYAQAFPDARFIVIVRDGRAVCRSYLDTSTFSLGRPSNAIAAADKWSREVKLQLEFMNAYPGRYLRIQYEDLVRDFAPHVGRIADYLELDDPADMLRYHEDTSSGTHIHAGNQNVLTPPDASRIDTWRAALTSREIGEFESIAGQMLNSLGYETSGPARHVGSLRRWHQRLSDRITQEIRWQKYKRAQKSS